MFEMNELHSIIIQTDEMPDTNKRNKLLEQIAECCLEQRNYHYAAKKYTQAGNKLQAMRSLIKSGDTQKIVFFANTARSQEIYLLAANYLQTLDWKKDSDLIKQIEHFYNKASAPEHLASFYEACAQVEIDDCRDYVKACEALNAALRCLGKAAATGFKNTADLEDKQADLNRMIGIIRKFLRIRSIYESDPVDAVRQLESMIDNKQITSIIRIGDIFAVLIVHNFQNQDYQKAYSLIKKLMQREPNVDVSEFINSQILDKICDQLQSPRLTASANASNDEQPMANDDIDYSYEMKRRIRREVKK